MPTTFPNPLAIDPFGLAGWCLLLRAADEIRNSDAEMMDAMMESAPAKSPRSQGRQDRAPDRRIGRNRRR